MGSASEVFIARAGARVRFGECSAPIRIASVFCYTAFMRINLWYLVLSVFYIVLAVTGYNWLISENRLAAFIPLTDFILMALAIMRLTRLFTYDAITAFVRDWFAGADPLSLRGALGTLVNCPWCTGLWFSLVVVFCYFVAPIAWYAILVLALSSLASFFQILANLIGWSAEAKKREVTRLS